MHDINYSHQHELIEHDFLGCCKNCRASLEIIKPHIMAFAGNIKGYTKKMLEALKPEELYRLYQLLDDLAHMEAGGNLAGLILDEPDIRAELPLIRSYYSTFFDIHETHLAKNLLKSHSPWETLKSFPLYPRYETLIRNQIEAMHIEAGSTLVFIGCGPVPISLILMDSLYGLRSVGLDISSKTVELSKKVIKCLGLEKKIKIICGDDSNLKEIDWDMVLVSALAEPKVRIFKSLREVLKKRKNHVPVVFRTYTGMRAVLYEPVQPEDIKGFKIISQVLPTGRVNNTIVFAELL